MAKFHDMIDTIGAGEDGLPAYPETFIDDITSAYNEDASIPDARIQVLETDLAAASQEILRLKAHNYELLQQIPAGEPEENPDDSNSSDGEENEETEEGVDSLFGDKKDKE